MIQDLRFRIPDFREREKIFFLPDTFELCNFAQFCGDIIPILNRES